MSIKIVVVGLGKIAVDQHLPVIAESNDFELVATVSSRGGVAEVPNYANVSDLIGSGLDIDAVALCAPPGPRAEMALRSIEAGYHVLLEKPPGVSSPECVLLKKAAADAGVTIFASWHSRFASMVAPTKAWVEHHECTSVELVWAEDAKKWHPGQDWVTKKDGYGVFDAGINGLSILLELFPNLSPQGAVHFERPDNWESPIAASFELVGSGIHCAAKMDWRAPTERWEIKVHSSKRSLLLSQGGACLEIDGEAHRQSEAHQEYRGVYARFSDLINAKQSSFDFSPLALVEELHFLASWQKVEPLKL